MNYCILPSRFAVMALIAFSTDATADDAKVNTPVTIAGLKGEWALPPKGKGGFQETLTLDGSSGGQWHQSQQSIPVSITFYVEGNELLVQHYTDPKGDSNYRVKQLRFAYKLEGDTLALTSGTVTETWKRVAEASRK